MRCKWNSYFYLLLLSKQHAVFSAARGVLTDLFPIIKKKKKAALFGGRSERRARVTWPPPLFPAAGACPLLAPASLRQHSGAALGALTEREKTLLANRRPPPHWKPRSVSSTTHLKKKHTHVSFYSCFSCPFYFLGTKTKNICQNCKEASPHNGDSCGVCPCWLRTQPWVGNGAGPRAGLRRRASVQQPLLHRGRSLRNGLVSVTDVVTSSFWARHADSRGQRSH